MGSEMALSYLNISDLESSKSRSLTFRNFTPRKGPELGHMLPLNFSMKTYTGSPMAQSHLTLGEPERSKSSSPDLEGLYLLNELELDHILLLVFNSHI